MLDPDDPDLHDALEWACMDVMGGDPPGPLLASRLQRACLDVLRSRGCEGARVVARSGRDGTFVQIGLPAPGDTVRQVTLRLT